MSVLIYSTKLVIPRSSASAAFIGVFCKTYISDRLGTDLLLPAAQMAVGKVAFCYYPVFFEQGLAFLWENTYIASKATSPRFTYLL